MTNHDNRWALVLAAGDGRRHQGLTQTTSGTVVPKQFCSLTGGLSFLEETIRRAQSVVARSGSARWWHPGICAIGAPFSIRYPRVTLSRSLAIAARQSASFYRCSISSSRIREHESPAAFGSPRPQRNATGSIAQLAASSRNPPRPKRRSSSGRGLYGTHLSSPRTLRHSCTCSSGYARIPLRRCGV